jgi:hypothetical protein
VRSITGKHHLMLTWDNQINRRIGMTCPMEDPFFHCAPSHETWRGA